MTMIKLLSISIMKNRKMKNCKRPYAPFLINLTLSYKK